MELRIKTVPRETAISSSLAWTIGATAAMALPPEMALPTVTKNAILALNFLTTDCPFAVGALCRSQRDRLTPSVCPSRQRECCHCAVPCAEKQLGEEHCCLVARDFNWAYGAYCIEGREPAQDAGERSGQTALGTR